MKAKFSVGDKVKINYDKLDTRGLTKETNSKGKDYLTYLKKNKEKIYAIIEVIIEKQTYHFNSNASIEISTAPYKLDDAYLEVSFYKNELISVKKNSKERRVVGE